MSMQNLAIVFGPTLFGQPLAADGVNGTAMPDTFHQNLVCRFHLTSFQQVIWWLNSQAIETILMHYVDIFVDETDVWRSDWPIVLFVLSRLLIPPFRSVSSYLFYIRDTLPYSPFVCSRFLEIFLFFVPTAWSWFLGATANGIGH